MRAHDQHRRSRRSPRLQLEALEDRCLLSTYALTDLGTNLHATAVNNLGQVAGSTTVSGQVHAFLWSNGTLTDLGTLGPAGGAASVNGVNGSGVVVGEVGSPTGNPQAFLLSHGTMTEPAGLNYAIAINDAGQVAGAGNVPGGAALYQNGSLTALTPTANFGQATAISGNGQVAGFFGPDGGLDYGTFLWDPVHGLQNLGAVRGDPDSSANGVNDAGQVVGMSGAGAGGPIAFLSSNGQMVSLGTLPGGTSSGADAINNAGQVVGWSAASGSSHAFLYSNGVMANLNNLVPAGSGLTLSEATAINNAGQIVANASDAAGHEHAVLLTPVAGPTFTASGFPSPVTAGVAGTVTVTVRNPDGSIDTGYTGTVHFTSSDPQAVLPADYTFTAADHGAHPFSATLKTAGTQSLTVTDTTTAGLFAAQTGIAVTPAAATHFLIRGPGSVAAGTAFSITVAAVDAYGNIATGYTGTVRVTSSDTKATLPSNYTFKATDQGEHTFTGLKLKTKGQQTITVIDTLTGSIEGSLTSNVT